MKRLVVLAGLLGLSVAANAALSVIITGAITQMLDTVLSMWRLLLLAGISIWVATLVANRFAPDKPTPTGEDGYGWNTYSQGGHTHKVRRKKGDGRGFDAVDDVDSGHRTYTFRD